MKIKDTKIKRVRKFVLDEPDDRDKYEKIINDSKYVITREEFAYDRMARAIVTIWYEEED